MTRVKPLGDAIINNHNLVNILLSLIILDKTIEFGKFSNSNVFYQGGQGEKELPPSSNHLAGIIKKIINDEKFRSFVRKKDKSTYGNRILRDKLFNLDSETIELALSSFRDWNTFEGNSKPDLFIESEQYIIVVEGKRTEADITHSTTYLPNRCQMVRHIENALEYCECNKTVIGFYIVEDTCNYKEHCTREYFRKSLELETIQKNNAQKEEIVNSFYDYPTWQDISKKLKIVYPQD